MDVDIRTLPAMRLAYMRHTGPYSTPGIGQTWMRFGAWCAQHGLSDPPRDTYGIAQDSPSVTAPDLCRYDCCIAVDESFKPSGEVAVQQFAGGRYACAPFTGTSADMGAAWMRMYGEWLPKSGWQADTKPGVEIYEPDFVVDAATGAFRCTLCVPLKADA